MSNSMEIFSFLIQNNIISIYGESGTGKSTLALQICHYLLSDKGSCIWIQASEVFPKRRFLSFSQQNFLSHIYLNPRTSACKDYSQFMSALCSLIGENAIFPPDLRCIVIDNISHHLRYATGNEDIARNSRLKDEFFNKLLFPLIMRCSRENIVLILIHEVSYNFEKGKNVPFFNSLYERIDSLNVGLSKGVNSTRNIMSIEHNDLNKKVSYSILEKGIQFSSYLKE